jgi:hypothetical protein
MKKVAIVALSILLLVGCFAVVGCSKVNEEELLQDAVESACIAELAIENLWNGYNLSYEKVVITSKKEVSDGYYEVEGKFYAMRSGTRYYCYFDGTAEYDPSAQEFDADVDLGTFYKV